MPIRCEIVSQDRLVYQGDVDMVLLPGSQGEMGILPNHAPLLSTLRYGVLKIYIRDHEEVFTIAGGIVEVQPNLVTVMADSAENVNEIDISRAEAARNRAVELLKQEIPISADAYSKIEAALQRSNLRLDAVKRFRSRPSRISGVSEDKTR